MQTFASGSFDKHGSWSREWNPAIIFTGHMQRILLDLRRLEGMYIWSKRTWTIP